LQPAFQVAWPCAVQFLPPYVKPGPKSKGGMMSSPCPACPVPLITLAASIEKELKCGAGPPVAWHTMMR
jgi:hypothetical protein